jgi:hypothetical protein
MAEVTYEQALGRRERDWLLQQVDIRERGLRTDMLGSTVARQPMSGRTGAGWTVCTKSGQGSNFRKDASASKRWL